MRLLTLLSAFALALGLVACASADDPATAADVRQQQDGAQLESDQKISHGW